MIYVVMVVVGVVVTMTGTTNERRQLSAQYIMRTYFTVFGGNKMVQCSLPLLSPTINFYQRLSLSVCVCGRTACILSRSSCLRSVSKYLWRWNRKANAFNMLALGTERYSLGRRTTEPAETCSFSLFEKLFNGAHSNVFYDHIIYPKICSCISKLERQQATAKRNLAQTHTSTWCSCMAFTGRTYNILMNFMWNRSIHTHIH